MSQWAFILLESLSMSIPKTKVVTKIQIEIHGDLTDQQKGAQKDYNCER
jgi:hypothetical protein